MYNQKMSVVWKGVAKMSEKYECDWCGDEIEPEDLFCLEDMTFHAACYKQRCKQVAPPMPEELEKGCDKIHAVPQKKEWNWHDSYLKREHNNIGRGFLDE